jgi:hypothetical protein
MPDLKFLPCPEPGSLSEREGMGRLDTSHVDGADPNTTADVPTCGGSQLDRPHAETDLYQGRTALRIFAALPEAAGAGRKYGG